VKVLIESGADVNSIDDEGWTPLHVACDEVPDSEEESDKGHKSVVKALLESEAYINTSTKDGTSPLHSACKLSENLFRSIVPMLILAGADTHAQDGEGRLPIDVIEDDRCRGIYKKACKKAEAQVENQALKPAVK
jgi:serine/threonine-protein phosphatase 6 regulatory ankyrin repeat subunit B